MEWLQRPGTGHSTKGSEIVDQVSFDGNGQPKDSETRDGDILILVQGRSVSVVRLALLPPEDFGPELEHALNNSELESEVFSLVVREEPRLLRGDRDFTLRCPEQIAKRAKFRADA